MLTRVVTYAPRVWKAIVAGVGAGSGAYAGAVDGGVTAAEWIVVVAFGVAGGVAVWLAPNKPATA